MLNMRLGYVSIGTQKRDPVLASGKVGGEREAVRLRLARNSPFSNSTIEIAK